jgi:hypothetical protein
MGRIARDCVLHESVYLGELRLTREAQASNI